MIRAMLSSPGSGGGRSAFAAAFLSFLFPGLGQVYTGRFARALGFAAPAILALAFLAGVLISKHTRDPFLAQFASPSWLVAALLINVLLLIYRALAIVDAYRLATEGEYRGFGRSNLRTLSVAGLAAVLLVLAVGHVAVARLNYSAFQIVTGLGSGDTGSIEPNDSGFESGLVTPPPTATLGPGESPASTDEPTATPIQGPAWDGKERLNILLIGADRRPGGGGYLTDTMIVASIDPATKQIAMFSLPRDTTRVPLPSDWVAAHRYTNGVYPNKINTLYTIARNSKSLFPGTDAQRGFIALKGALGELYQLDIKYYVALDFQGFLDVVAALGGVTVDVQVPVQDDHYPTDDGRGSLNLYIPPGLQHMDGPSALAYARARHATSDFDRAQRQQRIITSIRNQTDLATLLAPGRIDALFASVRKTGKTDIPPELFPRLVTLAQSVDLGNLRSSVFSNTRYVQPCSPCPGSGLYELIPNVANIRRAVADAFTVDPAVEQQREKIGSEGAKVTVLRGSERQGQQTQIAAYLQDQGFDATVPTENGGRADRTDYQQTIVRAYNGAETEMPVTAAALSATFGVTIEPVADVTQTVNFSIITGGLTPNLTPAP
jgi:LCP family protein required for cell wall assembly